MTSSNPNRQALQDYKRGIEEKLRNHPFEVGELAFRADFENLFRGFAKGSYRALHEPLGVAIGQPDFIIQRNAIPVGYVESKDIGTDLKATEKSEQLKRYTKGLHNLILTDYLTFRWYVDGEQRGEEVRLATVGSNGALQLVKNGYQDVELLLQNFLSQDISLVDTPTDLAQRMAVKCRLLRDTTRDLVEAEAKAGRVFPLLKTYRDLLVSDLNRDDFADMYAQTAAYGLFAAWQKAPDGDPFTRQSAVFTQMTPFLQETLGQVAGPLTQRELAWVIDDIAQLLDRTDREGVMKGFARGPGQDDPIIHFYEDFLAAYDSAMRERRGVYYTPLPVVSYIVNSIDYLLRDSFNIEDGLADKQRVASGKFHRVTILDPAVGTGTFLREVIANVKETIRQKGLGGIWPQYVKDDLLPRLHGFELLMAPYTISHLSLAIAFGGIDIGEDEINVVLTNTLEPAHGTVPTQPGLGAESMEEESARADDVKRDRPVMVVLGNPPYSGHSANKGTWIRDLLRGKDNDDSTSSYFHVDGQPLGERNPKWVNNDYVKFIRFAQRRIELTGEGVLGFITDNSYLDGPTFRGMRHSLMKTFDDIYILDLHGNSKRRERTLEGAPDVNVFDIQQGVAIALFVKRLDSGEGLATVHHEDLWGDRASKYEQLTERDVNSTKWTTIAPRAPQYFFVPRDSELEAEYERGFAVPKIFPVNSAGIVTGRDKLTINWDKDAIFRVAAA